MCRCELRVRWKLSSAHSAATTRPYWQTHCMFPSVFISVLNYCITFALCMLLHCFSEDLWYMCHERSTGVCIENALFFFFFLQYFTRKAHCHQTNELFKWTATCTYSVWITIDVAEFTVSRFAHLLYLHVLGGGRMALRLHFNANLHHWSSCGRHA